jgi:hypothetical protein
MAATFLRTLADLVDHLRVKARGGGDDSEQLDLHQAAINGLQRLAEQRDWRFFHKHHRVYFDAPDTATAAYTHSTLALTRSSGAWPSWARYGKVTLGDRVCEVASRDSDTVLTLDADLNPGEDVASASVTLFRSTYQLPADWRGQWEPIDEGKEQYCYVSPDEWLIHERNFPGETNQWAFTIMRDEDDYGRFALRLLGYPSALESLDFIYVNMPRALKYTGYETQTRGGTLAATAAGTTATGTSTTWPADVVGSVLRVTDSTTLWPTGVGLGNVWSEQKIITTRTSATSLVVDSEWDATYAGVKYVISDPIDVSQGKWLALLRSAEHELAILRSGAEKIKLTYELYVDAVRQAMANESFVRPASAGISRKAYFRGGIVDAPTSDV